MKALSSSTTDTFVPSDEPEPQRARSRGRALALAVVLLLLLLLCMWCLLWPVPSTQEGAGRRLVRGVSGEGTMAIEVIDARNVEGTVGSKGRPVLILFSLRNQGAERRLDLSQFTLQVDSIRLPPLDPSSLPGTGSGLPSVAPAGSTIQGALRFAVPYGPAVATLSASFPDIEPDDAPSARVELPAGDAK